MGYLPVSFGLGWWGSITSTLVGLLVGSALFAPLSLLSTRTGTNSAVSSGAHFGVVGRIVGSLVGIFTAIGFYALTVWTGGNALVQGLHKLFGMPAGNAQLVVAYAIIAITDLGRGDLWTRQRRARQPDPDTHDGCTAPARGCAAGP